MLNRSQNYSKKLWSTNNFSSQHHLINRDQLRNQRTAYNQFTYMAKSNNRNSIIDKCIENSANQNNRSAEIRALVCKVSTSISKLNVKQDKITRSKKSMLKLSLYQIGDIEKAYSIKCATPLHK
jgi:hypothetical protein